MILPSFNTLIDMIHIDGCDNYNSDNDDDNGNDDDGDDDDHDDDDHDDDDDSSHNHDFFLNRRRACIIHRP